MEQFFTIAVEIFEVLGTAVMLLGLPVAVVVAVIAGRRAHSGEAAFTALRRTVGFAILLGLELLVAADIIKTLIAPGLEDVAVLGIIVLIRTILSFALQIEIEGTLPWRRALTTTAPQLIDRAVRAAREESAARQAPTE